MKLIDNGIIRDARPGDRVGFSHGSTLVVQKDGSLKNVQPKRVGKKRRKRPARQRQIATV